VDAGAQHLVSQLFFDNEDFLRFLERARIAGITVPIEAGIMPVLNQKSIERMVSLCGASIPRKLSRILARYGDHPEALREAVKILRAVEKEEKRIEIVGKVCGNCAKWERDAATKNGGFCPLPIRNRPGRKYKTRRTKACLQFEPKKGEETDHE